jgi:hypothetical protein
MAFTRKELYDLVWCEPMIRLARRYGLSDVGLAKVCREYDIPRPPRGYWAKKRVGRTSRQTRLPRPDDNQQIELQRLDECQIASRTIEKRLTEKMFDEERSALRMEVAESLRGCHALVSQANQELQAANTNQHGLIVLPERPALSLQVSKASLRRSLLIMDALLKGLEQRQYRVSNGPVVEISGVKLRFEISERLEVVHEETEESSFDEPYTFRHSCFNRRLSPSGKLILHLFGVDCHWHHGCRQTWRDGGRCRLEDRLNNFVRGVIRFVAREKVQRAEEERKAQARREEQQRRQQEAQLRAEKRALIKTEQARVDALMTESVRWRQSQDLRDYIEARRRKYLASHAEMQPDGEFSLWLDWAVRQADRLDPFLESPPSVLDEIVPDEKEDQSYSKLDWNP